MIAFKALSAVFLTVHLAYVASDPDADAEPGWTKVLVKKRLQDGYEERSGRSLANTFPFSQLQHTSAGGLYKQSSASSLFSPASDQTPLLVQNPYRARGASSSLGFGRQQHFQQQQQVFQPAQQFGQFGQRQFAPQQHGRNYQVTPQYAGNFQPQQSGLGYGNPASGYQSIHSFGAAEASLAQTAAAEAAASRIAAAQHAAQVHAAQNSHLATGQVAHVATAQVAQPGHGPVLAPQVNNLGAHADHANFAAHAGHAAHHPEVIVSHTDALSEHRLALEAHEAQIQAHIAAMNGGQHDLIAASHLGAAGFSNVGHSRGSIPIPARIPAAAPAPVAHVHHAPAPAPAPAPVEHIHHVPAPAPAPVEHIHHVPAPAPAPVEHIHQALAPAPVDHSHHAPAPVDHIHHPIAPAPVDHIHHAPVPAPAPVDHIHHVAVPAPAPVDHIHHAPAPAPAPVDHIHHAIAPAPVDHIHHAPVQAPAPVDHIHHVAVPAPVDHIHHAPAPAPAPVDHIHHAPAALPLAPVPVAHVHHVPAPAVPIPAGPAPVPAFLGDAPGPDYIPVDIGHVAIAGEQCVEKIITVEETESDEQLDCKHSYDKKCHTTYTTDYEPQEEEECEENYKKNCFIEYKKVAHNVTVEFCHTPLVKDCNLVGPVECKTEYEAMCATRFHEHQVVDDIPDCTTIKEYKCRTVQKGYKTEQDCKDWPVQKCSLRSELVKKVSPETSCEKIPKKMCAPKGCGFVPGLPECFDKTESIVQEVPEETCELNPQKHCKHVTKLVPNLKPVEECVDVPKEICHRSRTNPRKVAKPVVKKWCYTPSKESGLI